LPGRLATVSEPRDEPDPRDHDPPCAAAHGPRTLRARGLPEQSRRSDIKTWSPQHQHHSRRGRPTGRIPGETGFSTRFGDVGGSAVAGFHNLLKSMGLGKFLRLGIPTDFTGALLPSRPGSEAEKLEKAVVLLGLGVGGCQQLLPG